MIVKNNILKLNCFGININILKKLLKNACVIESLYDINELVLKFYP